MNTWVVPGYAEVRALGQGGSGRVVLCSHQPTGTPVAIKYLDEQLRTDEPSLREFRAEARLLAGIESPNVVRLYEYVEAVGGTAIVMELVNGVTLRQMLREHGPTEPEAALCVLKGSLLGLAAGHAAGVVHRDYKPENVLIDATGQSKLADFGIAVRAGRDAPVAGTPTYMAPEQWAGAPASAATDIYAATVTFYECLTGAPPYSAGDLTALRRQHERAAVPLDSVPPAVHGLLRNGLAKEASRRPADAPAFLADLESAARAGFGDDWERKGRGSLARRAALLALLFPLAGGVTGGSALATTVLGGLRLPRVAVAIGTIVVIATGVGTGIGLVPGVAGGPTAIGVPWSITPLPSATPVPPSPTLLPTATPEPVPSLTTTQPAPPPPPPPKQPPPPPQTKVTSISVQVNEVSTYLYRATLQVKTSGTGQVTIFVRFGGSATEGGSGSTAFQTYSIKLSGSTSYSRVVPATGGYSAPGGCRSQSPYYVVARVTASPAGPTALDSIAC